MPETANTVKYVDYRGIRGLVAAELLTDDANGITYGDPFAVCGMSTLSKTTEVESSKKFYDNQPAIIIQAKGADEVSIEGSVIPDEVLAKLMGEYYDPETGLYVEGESTAKEFAIGYITKKTDGTEVFVWRLKGTFSYPETEHATEDDGTDSTGHSITFSGMATNHKFTKTGKVAKAVNLPAEKYAGGETAFFAKVQTPDTIGAA